MIKTDTSDDDQENDIKMSENETRKKRTKSTSNGHKGKFKFKKWLFRNKMSVYMEFATLIFGHSSVENDFNPQKNCFWTKKNGFEAKK